MISGFWGNFKKFALVISVLIALVSGYDFITKNKSKVSIVVSHQIFTWPTIPDIPYPKKDDDVKFYANLVASLEILEKYSMIESAWYVGIYNNGGKEAKNLRLKIPHTQVYQLSREGFDLAVKEYNEFVSIKDIQPEESIYVVGWVTKSLGDEDIEEVKLTHSNGIADKTALVTIESHWKWISQKWDHIVIVILLLGCLIFLVVQNYNEKA